MAHEILSIKMYELDGKIGRLHSRIQMSESADRDKIRAEAAALRRECEEEKLTLRDKLRFSRAGMVARLSEAYGEIERIIQRAKDGIRRDDGGAEPSPDEKILLAEYALDFAMQAADHALLIAMEALDAQMTQQEEEGK